MNRNSKKIKQTGTIVRIRENKEAKELRKNIFVYECSENVNAKTREINLPRRKRTKTQTSENFTTL